MTILRQDRFAVLTDQWGRFRSLRLASPIEPTVGPGDDGFLWLDIGVDGTLSAPVWKMWDEAADTWRQIGNVSGDYLTLAQHAAIGDDSPHHPAATLDANADALLSLSTQELGLDTQSANRVFAGPSSGAAAEPCFRSLVHADMPTVISAFLARPSADISNITGDGTAYQVVLPSEIFDRGGDYDTSTGLFTAPKTGIYPLFGSLYVGGIISSHTSMLIAIVTSNRVYGVVYANPYPLVVATDRVIFGVSCLADMDVGDTAYLRLTVSGGTKVVDIIYSSAYTYFGGYLLSE